VKQLDFLPRLESLRGVAALIVVGYHASHRLSGGSAYNWFDGFAWRVLTAVSNGTGAVVVFFVLSGFVLARSLESNSDPVRFLRNRVFRLFPAAMAVVALLTMLHWQFGFFVGYEASFDPLDVFLNLLMIWTDINGVMWSVTVECAATPLILAERLAVSQAWRAPALGADCSAARVVVLGPLRASARRLYQSYAAICLRRRGTDAFSGSPVCGMDSPGAGDVCRNCRDGRLLLLWRQELKAP
jgi:peptidoglycan/LPS O-acetylase OafA/YrhL